MPTACGPALGIYRRVCLLRAKGEHERAARLESEDFSRAMAEANSSRAESPLPWPELLAAEDRRVADALAFAEVLAPLLAERLAATGFAAAPLAVPGDAPSTRPAPRRPLAGLPPPDVADLIEGMLEQERSEEGRRQLRAS
ncbi:MAG TPA: hypothetical protein VG838_05395 [Opitutaceae bacterium]|nr:hypothetical protein [Opitutaceae bacterium]